MNASISSNYASATELAAEFGLQPRHVLRMAKAGKFPKPLKFGTLSRWSRAQVQAWVQAQTAGAAVQGA